MAKAKRRRAGRVINRKQMWDDLGRGILGSSGSRLSNYSNIFYRPE